MAAETKHRPVIAMMAAISVSGFITSELVALLFALSSLLPDGAIQKTAYTLSGLAALAFFIWLGHYAYTVEINLMTGKYDVFDE